MGPAEALPSSRGRRHVPRRFAGPHARNVGARLRRFNYDIASVRIGPQKNVWKRRRRRVSKMVPAVRRWHAPRPETARERGDRHWRSMETRHARAIALSFRIANNALPRIWVLFVPRAFLV